MRRSLLLVCVLMGCQEEAPKGQAPSRFAAVESPAKSAAAKSFCEKSWTEADAPRFTFPPERPVPGVSAPTAFEGWRWVNLWASWCKPCIEELPLLERWGKALAKEGTPIRFEMLSIDEEGPALTKAIADHPELPGPVRWLRSPEDLKPLLESLGTGSDTAIPIHALVSPAGGLRCVRVGQVHEGAYGAVKQLVSAP